MSNITPFVISEATGFAIKYWQDKQLIARTHADSLYCMSQTEEWYKIKCEAEKLMENKQYIYVSTPKETKVTFRIYYQICNRSKDVFRKWVIEESSFLEEETSLGLIIKIGNFAKKNNDLNYYIDIEKSERCVFFDPQILTIANREETFYTATETYRDQKEEAVKKLEQQNKERRKDTPEENKKTPQQEVDSLRKEVGELTLQIAVIKKFCEMLTEDFKHKKVSLKTQDFWCCVNLKGERHDL